MIEGLKPYPTMKASRVPSLGNIPSHWDIWRLRNVVDMRVSTVDKHTKEGEEPVRLCNYVDVYKNDRIRADMPLMRATATREEIDRFRVEPGDVLITKDSEAWDDIGVPALVKESASDMVCGYHLALLRPFEGSITGDFLIRALQSGGVAHQFHVEANGVTRYGLSHSAIKSIWLPVPAIRDQIHIARFLDYADRRIQRYIRAKQKLIKLLEEQKQAVVHRVVTRGLHPNVRLMPSGIAWLGDVPAHWRTMFLARCLRRIDQGWSPVAAEGELVPDQWAVLTLSSVRRGRFDEAAIKPLPITTSIPSGIDVHDGDLLLTRSNTRDLVGDVCVVRNVRPKTILSDLVYRLIPEPTVLNRRFLMFQLLSPLGRRQIERDARGSSGTMPKIAQRHVRSWVVLVPPLAEQDAIVHALGKATSAFDSTIERASTEIALVGEYRSRLIADVVTGKLDVREAAARLPVEADVPEPLDEAEIPTGDEAPDDASAEPEPIEA